jgi:hypothetical protein
MQRFVVILFCFAFILGACTLSGEQESRLNEQLNQYIEAINDNNPLVVTAGTHPAIVKYYKKSLDSTFVMHFQQKENADRLFFNNPMMQETKESGKTIQRTYLVEKATETDFITDDYRIFALSDNGGESWFFAREEDYFDSQIKELKRLFKK